MLLYDSAVVPGGFPIRHWAAKYSFYFFEEIRPRYFLVMSHVVHVPTKKPVDKEEPDHRSSPYRPFYETIDQETTETAPVIINLFFQLRIIGAVMMIHDYRRIIHQFAAGSYQPVHHLHITTATCWRAYIKACIEYADLFKYFFTVRHIYTHTKITRP